MLKIIKLGNNIYQNIEPFTVDENDNVNWNIPSTVEELRPVVIDTVNWWIGDKVKKKTGNVTKLSAANSKAIALLAKIVAALAPDTGGLSDLEKSAWDKLQNFAQNGYADSKLLNDSLQAVIEYVERGGMAVEAALKADSVEKLIEILNGLD